jgi:hypothetical protein
MIIIGGVATAGVAAGPAAAADCDGPRLVGVSGSRVAEGTERGGFAKLDFQVSSSGCAAEGSLRFETVGYTAQKDDFVPQAGELSYQAGAADSRTISVLVFSDSEPERNECFSVRLSGAIGNVKIDPAEAAGIILDDDGKRRLPGQILGFICSE